MYQDRIWYLFKEVAYYIDNQDYVVSQTSFYLYNDISKATYKDFPSLEEAIGTAVNFKDKNLFTSLILKGQVPLFDKFSSQGHNNFYKYHEISKALPLIEIGSTFINKAVSYYSYVYYKAIYPNLIEKYLEVLQKFKEQKQSSRSSFRLKKGDRELLDKGNNILIDITLLSCSKERPTIDEVVESWPELLL